MTPTKNKHLREVEKPQGPLRSKTNGNWPEPTCSVRCRTCLTLHVGCSLAALEVHVYGFDQLTFSLISLLMEVEDKLFIPQQEPEKPLGTFFS